MIDVREFETLVGGTPDFASARTSILRRLCSLGRTLSVRWHHLV